MARWRTLVGAGTVAAVALVAAVPAGAAPAREAVLGVEVTSYTWEHGPVVSAGSDAANPLTMCTDPGFPCDDTLIELTAEGRLKLVTTAVEELPNGLAYRPDVDIYLYRSDRAGTVGQQVAASETPDATETITVARAKPGFYLLRVAYFSGINVSYEGTATFTHLPPPA